MEKIVDRNNVYQVVEVKNGKEKFVEVKPAEDFSIALRDGEKENVKLSGGHKGKAQAPLNKGDSAGKLEVYLDGKLVANVQLEYTESVESNSPFFHLKKILRGYF
jgi:D-alanyl-D-alanine carboxypeptidase